MVNFINVQELLTRARKLVRFLIEASVEQRVGCFFGLLKTLKCFDSIEASIIFLLRVTDYSLKSTQTKFTGMDKFAN